MAAKVRRKRGSAAGAGKARPRAARGAPPAPPGAARCRPETWYIARAALGEGIDLREAALRADFFGEAGRAESRMINLRPLPGRNGSRTLAGWIQSPLGSSAVRLRGFPGLPEPKLDEVFLRGVPERDPKCHPAANIPRWDEHFRVPRVRRVFVPRALAGLAQHVDTVEIVPLDEPSSLAELRERIRGQAAILDPAWRRALRMRYADLAALAGEAIVLVDLETVSLLGASGGAFRAHAVTYEARHGIFSARVEYSDVATRGCALQDVVPYTFTAETGAFACRALTTTRSWKRHADDVGFATLLSSETPWATHNAEVLSAARPTPRGELIATDLPWLVAGEFGPLLAPRLAQHLLRMHLCAPLESFAQQWNRADDTGLLVRDIAEFARRYSPLRAVRWAGPTPGAVELGIVLPGAPGIAGAPQRPPLILRTGRIDALAPHDGLPAEPLIILMKWLAREAREGTAWSRDRLAGRTIVWQFSSAAGGRYAAAYESAALLGEISPQVLELRMRAAPIGRPTAPGARVIEFDDEGIFGDGSLEFGRELWRCVTSQLEREP